MMYDIKCPANLSAALDTEQRKLRTATSRRDAAMVVIEAARETRHWLTTDEYISFKIIHGNAEADVERARVYLRAYGRAYYGVQSAEWLFDQDNIEPRKYTLAQVWRLWRAVLAARDEVKQLGSSTIFSDDIDMPMDNGSTRERIDALVALDAAEGLYNIVSRAHDGKRPLTWEERRARPRVRRPTRPEPTRSTKRGAVTRSTYIGE